MSHFALDYSAPEEIAYLVSIVSTSGGMGTQHSGFGYPQFYGKMDFLPYFMIFQSGAHWRCCETWKKPQIWQKPCSTFDPSTHF